MESEKTIVLGLILAVAALGAVTLLNEQLSQGDAQGLQVYSKRMVYTPFTYRPAQPAARPAAGLGQCCAPNYKWPVQCAPGLECRGWNVPGHQSFGTCTRAGAPYAAQLSSGMPAYCGV